MGQDRRGGQCLPTRPACVWHPAGGRPRSCQAMVLGRSFGSGSCGAIPAKGLSSCLCVLRSDQSRVP